MAKALDQTTETDIGNLGAAVGQQFENGNRFGDLDESSADGKGHFGPARDYPLAFRAAAGNAVDEVDIGQHRRTRQHVGRDFRLVARQPGDDVSGRMGAGGESFGQGEAHFWRRVVQQQRQRRLRRTAVLEGASGFEIDMGQRACGMATLRRRSMSDHRQIMLYCHEFYTPSPYCR